MTPNASQKWIKRCTAERSLSSCPRSHGRPGPLGAPREIPPRQINAARPRRPCQATARAAAERPPPQLPATPPPPPRGPGGGARPEPCRLHRLGLARRPEPLAPEKAAGPPPPAALGSERRRTGRRAAKVTAARAPGAAAAPLPGGCRRRTPLPRPASAWRRWTCNTWWGATGARAHNGPPTATPRAEGPQPAFRDAFTCEGPPARGPPPPTPASGEPGKPPKERGIKKKKIRRNTRVASNAAGAPLSLECLPLSQWGRRRFSVRQRARPLTGRAVARVRAAARRSATEAGRKLAAGGVEGRGCRQPISASERRGPAPRGAGAAPPPLTLPPASAAAVVAPRCRGGCGGGPGGGRAWVASAHG